MNHNYLSKLMKVTGSMLVSKFASETDKGHQHVIRLVSDVEKCQERMNRHDPENEMHQEYIVKLKT